jgi:hypothetical protein
MPRDVLSDLREPTLRRLGAAPSEKASAARGSGSRRQVGCRQGRSPIGGAGIIGHPDERRNSPFLASFACYGGTLPPHSPRKPLLTLAAARSRRSLFLLFSPEDSQ